MVIRKRQQTWWCQATKLCQNLMLFFANPQLSTLKCNSLPSLGIVAKVESRATKNHRLLLLLSACQKVGQEEKQKVKLKTKKKALTIMPHIQVRNIHTAQIHTITSLPLYWTNITLLLSLLIAHQRLEFVISLVYIISEFISRKYRVLTLLYSLPTRSSRATHLFFTISLLSLSLLFSIWKN